MRQSAFVRLATFGLAGLALLALARNVFAQDLEGGTSQPPGVTPNAASPSMSTPGAAPAVSKSADAITSQPADAESPREARRRRRRAAEESAENDEDAPREKKAAEEPHKARPFATASHQPHPHHQVKVARQSASTHTKKKPPAVKKHHKSKAKKKAKKKKTS